MTLSDLQKNFLTEFTINPEQCVHRLINDSSLTQSFVNKKTILVEELFHHFIRYASPNLFEQFLTAYPFIKEKIPQIGFTVLNSQYLDHEEYSNLLVLSLRNNRIEMAKYLLNKYHDSQCFLKGEVEISDSSKKNRVFSFFSDALSEAIKHDFHDIYENILTHMNSENLYSYLLRHNSIFDDPDTKSICALDYIIYQSDSKYLNILLPFMKKMLNDKNIISPQKSQSLIEHILSIKDLGCMQKILNILPDYLFNTDYCSDKILNPFWKNVLSQIMIDEHDIHKKNYYSHQIIQIYDFFKQKNAAFYQPNYFYTLGLLKNHSLLISLIEHGLDLNEFTYQPEYNTKSFTTPLIWILNNEIIAKQLNLEPNVYEKSLSIIYQYTVQPIQHNHYEQLLSSILKTQNKILIKLLTKEDVKRHNMLENLSCLYYYTNEEFFTDISFTLLNLGLNPFKKIKNQNHQDFMPIDTYLFLLKRDKLEIIFNHLNVDENQIKNLSKDISFWSNLGYNEVWDYIKENGADFNQREISNQICMQEQFHNAYSYFQYGGIIPDSSVINHLFLYEHYNKISLLLNFFPSLIFDKNYNEKYFLTELISKLISISPNNPKCVKIQNIVNLAIENAELYHHTELIKKLDRQLSSSSINKKFPTLPKSYFYYKLQSQIEKKDICNKPKL